MKCPFCGGEVHIVDVSTVSGDYVDYDGYYVIIHDYDKDVPEGELLDGTIGKACPIAHQEEEFMGCQMYDNYDAAVVAWRF